MIGLKQRVGKIKRKLEKINCKVIYFPYTKGTSSTLINKSLLNLEIINCKIIKN